MPGMVRGLALSCHPLPTLAVTAFSAMLAALAGNPSARCVLFALAVLGGQLSIGWSNDLLDAGRDAAVRRKDKPIATGAVPRRVVDVAITVSVAAAVGLSLRLGWRAGLLALVLVFAGWVYNLGAKATSLSWVPYAVGFGALPAAAMVAAGHTPPWWLVAAGALLGVGAHVANVLPDLAADAATGVRGFPHRLGVQRSVLVMFGALGAAVLAVALGPGLSSPPAWVAVAAAAFVLAAFAPLVLRNPSSKVGFYGVIALVALSLMLLATRYDVLSG